MGWGDEGDIKERDKPRFIFKEAKPNDKIVVTIFGEKGSGKTMTACGLSGTKAVICFDHKAEVIKKYFFEEDKELKVYDAIEYFTKEPELYLDSSEDTYEYVMFLLKNIKNDNPDWIIIDGLEILHNICEMVMRKHNNLKPYQGISNMVIWKERKQLLDSVHNEAIKCVKKGIIYTTYCDDDKVIEDGAIITMRKIPKWTDTVLYVTDVTIHVETDIDKNGSKTMIKVSSSKIPGFLKTGEIINITGKKLKDIVKI